MFQEKSRFQRRGGGSPPVFLGLNGRGGHVNPLSATRYVFFLFKEKKNIYLEGFQVILSFFPQIHTFYTILNLLIYAYRTIIYKKKENLVRKKTFLPYWGGGSESYGHVRNYQVFLTPSYTCWSPMEINNLFQNLV